MYLSAGLFMLAAVASIDPSSPDAIEAPPASGPISAPPTVRMPSQRPCPKSRVVPVGPPRLLPQRVEHPFDPEHPPVDSVQRFTLKD
jgi:hypothetical protein